MNVQEDTAPFARERRQYRRQLLTPNPKATLREQVHEVMRFFHYSERTEETYWQWIVRFLRFHREPPRLGPALSQPAKGAERERRWRHPREMGEEEVRAYLTHLATALQVGAAMQNQALSALVFLYQEVLHQPLGDFADFARAARPARVPEVLSREETRRVLAAVEPEFRLPLQLLYGSGLRVFELLRLRIKDLDLDRRQMVVRDGKGAKDRVTMVPEKLVETLREHLAGVRPNMRRMWPWVTPGSGCQTGWRGSIRARHGSGPGSGCFRPGV